MDWCSYFRLKDAVTFQAAFPVLKKEAKEAGYTSFANQNVNVANAVLQVAAFYKLSRPTDPQWLTFLGTAAGKTLRTAQLSRGHSGIILVEFNGHRYVLAYGSAHTQAKKLDIERRFGKIVVGNGKQQDEVRAIKAKVHGRAAKTRDERRGRGGPLGELEMPRRANMAAAVAAKMVLDGVEHVANGKESVRTVAPTTYADLITKLTQLEKWWNGGQETDQQLASFDRIVDISKNQALITQLDAQRLADLTAAQNQKFSLCLDDDELWDSTQFEYIVNRQRLVIGLPDEASILLALQNLPQGVDPMKVTYEAVVPTRNTPVSGRLAENLAYETTLPNSANSFIFESGAWYEAKASWLQQVNNDVQRLVTQSQPLLNGIVLPVAANAKESEDAYIPRLMTTAPLNVRCHQMHRVARPGGMPDVEPYDVCVDGTVLMFMKHGCDRAACGDVAQQVMDTVHALTNIDGAYLNWVNGNIAGRGWNFDMTNRSALTLCIVLITGNAGKTPLQFVIRAQDALSMHLREVEAHGFRAAVAVV